MRPQRYRPAILIETRRSERHETLAASIRFLKRSTRDSRRESDDDGILAAALHSNQRYAGGLRF